MRKAKSKKRSPRKGQAFHTIEIRGKKYQVDEDTLKQIDLGRGFMADYREVFERLAKS